MRRSYAGDQNPNFKNAGWKICCGCEKEFHHYNKTRKYCSSACYNSIRPKKEEVEKIKKQPHQKVCKGCGNLFKCIKTSNKVTCSDACKLKARELKATYQNCLQCGIKFKFSKSQKRLYCSYDCHIASGGAWRAGMAAAGATMKYGVKKDANHNEIVAALQQAGAYVLDMSHVGRGFPDLIVGFRSQTILVEIKNPKTSYGKKGLNKNQLKWKESWTGGAYCVVDSIDAALRAIGAIKETL
jgi:hypothetical protein